MKTGIPDSLITQNIDILNDVQKTSFHDQKHEIILIEEGDSLWRFISQKKHNYFSDFWVDNETMRRMMSIFRDWDNREENVRKDLIKSRLAITDQWRSRVSWRVKITFKKEVIAYRGTAASQKGYHEKETVRWFGQELQRPIDHRRGGELQYVIPRFKGITESDANIYAEIVHFSRI